jgi:hypothetical protein
VRRVFVQTLLIASVAARTAAQSADAGTSSSRDPSSQRDTWSGRGSTAFYALPDARNYLQPTFAADRDALHLESRYNYEARNSVSGFVGRNVAFGTAVVLRMTPMLGALVGDTAGIVPALELHLAWKRLEFYAEGEYVIDVAHPSDRFLYSWSETSAWITNRIRAGVVAQRTRAFQAPRDIQPGLLVGAAVAKFDAAVYFFNPTSNDRSFVTSVGVTF